MRGIVQCIHIYAQNHAGEFPPDLEALVAAGYGINKNMACPRTGRCYFLIPGAMGGEDANAPVLLEPPDSHSGGAHVAFADGRVILLASDEYARAAGGHLKTSKFLTSAEFDRKVNERLGLFRHRGQPSTALSSQPSSTRTATRPARAKRRFIWEDGRWSGEGEGSSP
ncbi:MAG: hypothetical protein JXQ73_15890 [Phycisphaerae bacterium]|nr:hypothetical protein [Phycisphaerae bacterium]